MSVRVVTPAYHEFDIAVLALRQYDRSRWLCRDVHSPITAQAVAVTVSTIFICIEINDDVVFACRKCDAEYTASRGFSARNRCD